MAAPVVLSVRSPLETASVAEVVASVVRGGDVILLDGGLGAGKTAFTQALASALGVTSPVTSPTFTLANRYEGTLTVHHLDAYRLDGLAEVIDLGLDELIGPDSVTVIEWGGTIAPALPGDRLEIALAFPDIEPGVTDEHRAITLTALGRGWERRLDGAELAEGLRAFAPTC